MACGRKKWSIFRANATFLSLVESYTSEQLTQSISTRCEAESHTPLTGGGISAWTICSPDLAHRPSPFYPDKSRTNNEKAAGSIMKWRNIIVSNRPTVTAGISIDPALLHLIAGYPNHEGKTDLSSMAENTTGSTSTIYQDEGDISSQTNMEEEVRSNRMSLVSSHAEQEIPFAHDMPREYYIKQHRHKSYKRCTAKLKQNIPSFSFKSCNAMDDFIEERMRQRRISLIPVPSYFLNELHDKPSHLNSSTDQTEEDINKNDSVVSMPPVSVLCTEGTSTQGSSTEKFAIERCSSPRAHKRSRVHHMMETTFPIGGTNYTTAISLVKELKLRSRFADQLLEKLRRARRSSMSQDRHYLFDM